MARAKPAAAKPATPMPKSNAPPATPPVPATKGRGKVGGSTSGGKKAK